MTGRRGLGHGAIKFWDGMRAGGEGIGDFHAEASGLKKMECLNRVFYNGFEICFAELINSRRFDWRTFRPRRAF